MPSQTPTLSVLLFDISIETLDDEIFQGLLSMHACVCVCVCVCVSTVTVMKSLFEATSETLVSDTSALFDPASMMCGK